MAKKDFKHKLVVFDAHAILHRGYHALPEFTSSKGEPTGGLYGLTAMLIRIIGELKPDYLVACYDRPEPTFRKQAYDAYKAKRPKADDGLVAQIERSKDIFTALNIPIFELPGFEGDDLIGTVVEQAKKISDLQIIVASGDMDTLQLVDGEQVLAYTLKKGINDTVVYNEKMVKERFGFGPELLPDFKGLRGDPSDNIIGIAGIGEKTATDLIVGFGSIEQIYKKLKKSEQSFLDAGIKARIVGLLKEGEEEAIFSKTLATIKRDVPVKFILPDQVWLETIDQTKAEKIFMDLEFKSLLARLKGLLNNQATSNEVETTSSSVDEPVIDSLDVKKTGLALWLLDSDLTNASLDEIYAFAETRDFAVAQEKIFARLHDQGLEKVYEQIELPLLPIIEAMQTRGILVDKNFLADLSVRYHKEQDKISQKIFALVGHEFNLNSPKQLGEVLFTELKISLKGMKKTAGGALSTRESELQKIAEAHPVIPLILDYRELQKLLSTYIDNLPTMLDGEDRLHTTLNQAGTTTGRMSSNNPNLQNIPAKGELGPEIRKAFVASPGYEFLSFDYSQIEMRVLALLSGDTDLQNIFANGQDIHASVASRVFGVPMSEVTKDMRRKAKVINFGIIYGMGVNALRTNLGGTREEAQHFYDQYFITFPTIKAYFDGVVSKAGQTGYTETWFGRRRYFPGLHSKLPFVRAQAERMAMNAPLQGTAADIIKRAMVEVVDSLKKKYLESELYLLLQIHDELLFEVKEGKTKEVSSVLISAMEEIDGLPMRFLVEGKKGESWGKMTAF
ncbi:MAG: DNA polymerase [Candidatus Paceibacterota bacterium]|jgi:DNA polymerase-1